MVYEYYKQLRFYLLWSHAVPVSVRYVTILLRFPSKAGPYCGQGWVLSAQIVLCVSSVDFQQTPTTKSTTATTHRCCKFESLLEYINCCLFVYDIDCRRAECALSSVPVWGSPRSPSWLGWLEIVPERVGLMAGTEFDWVMQWRMHFCKLFV